jgi:hypothetical protein
VKLGLMGAPEMANGLNYHVFGLSMSLLAGAPYEVYVWAEVLDGSEKSGQKTSKAYTGET